MRIRDDVGFQGGSWFNENVVRRVGNEADTYFWLDRWLGEVPFWIRFRQLFDLAKDRWVSIAYMVVLGWDEGGEDWWWRCRLLA